MRIVLVAGIALAALCADASAQMYRWIDKDGRTHYTQTPPPPDAKSVQKKPLGAGGGAAAYGDLPYATQNAARNYPVTLYTTPDCGTPCEQARSLLVRRVVPFKEVSVQRQKDIDNLKSIAGGTQVPYLIVGSQKQSGFLEDAYSALLDSAGYPASGPRLPLEALRKMEAPAPSKAPEPAEGAASGEEASK
jgi:glutaredoxin